MNPPTHTRTKFAIVNLFFFFNYVRKMHGRVSPAGQCVCHYDVCSTFVEDGKVLALGQEGPTHHALVMVVHLVQEHKHDHVYCDQ